mgnify:CR=1 FL=1
MYSFYTMLIEKVARILKVSPNTAVYLIFTTGLIVAGIAKLIEGHRDSFDHAIAIIIYTYSCGAFLTILNLILKDKDFFIKRDEAYLKTEKDA